MTGRLARTLMLLLGALCLSFIPASAQIVVRVIDAPSGNPLPLATVQSVDANGRVIETQSTDNTGTVRLGDVAAVRGVKVTALAYATQELDIQPTRAYGARIFEIKLIPTAFELEGLTVDVDATTQLPGRLPFTDRRASRTGIFLDPFDVGIKSKYGVVQVFTQLEGIRRTNFGGPRQMPTIVTNMGTGCVKYRLNNSRVRDPSWNRWPLSGLLPQDVMAVEIYRHFGEVPAHMQKDAWPPGANQLCGLVVIRMKRSPSRCGSHRRSFPSNRPRSTYCLPSTSSSGADTVKEPRRTFVLVHRPSVHVAVGTARASNEVEEGSTRAPLGVMQGAGQGDACVPGSRDAQGHGPSADERPPAKRPCPYLAHTANRARESGTGSAASR